jgi:aspartyl-tRNA(Asn)/glutamyl-tRNA(Gln) amidotransferase subunit A
VKGYGRERTPVEGTSLPATIAEAGAALHDGSWTARTLAEACLEHAEVLESRLNAFVEVTVDQALAAASTLDAELEAGRDRGPLHGIPIVFKDLYDMAGLRTTVGSRFLADSPPKERDSAVVRSLRAAGMVPLGKTNMDEFAAGGRGKNVFYGDTHNPWDPRRSPGGSSGGTAAAVASGTCFGGIGSDTGGSVRCPASMCGIVGLRPTSGLIDLTGAYPRSHTLDAAGPLARTVADASTLLEALVEGKSNGGTPGNRYSADLDRGVDGMRLGIIQDFTFRDIEPEVAAVMLGALEKLSELGAEILEVSLPERFLDSAGPLDVLLYEFDQILGDQYRAAEDKSVFGPAVRSDLERGARISRRRYEEVLARKSRQIAEVREVFERVDALLTPTQPMVAPPLYADDEVFGRIRQFLLPTSFIGLPSVTVPCGFVSEGLPVGLQVIGDRFEEAVVLRVAAAFESATDFHRRRPPIYRDRFPSSETGGAT